MTIQKLIIHCADTPPNMDVGAEEIRRWHVEGNGWSDIGYHYVIRRCGLIETGRDESTPGAHVRGHNTGSIGVCMVAARVAAIYRGSVGRTWAAGLRCFGAA